MVIFAVLEFMLTSHIILPILSAIIPPALLLIYIYKKDMLEKEPASLLFSLIFLGVLAAVCSVIIEALIMLAFENTALETSPFYPVIKAFIAVAMVEEGTKMYFVKRKTWNNQEFAYMFDGIVYTAFVSLGFAAIENIGYVFQSGISIALPRALLSIPGHFCFSVLMGVFYSRAKQCELYGDRSGKQKNLLYAYLSAVLLHGIYDACLMVETHISILIFIVFVIFMYIIVFRIVKNASITDRPLI